MIMLYGQMYSLHLYGDSRRYSKGGKNRYPEEGDPQRAGWLGCDVVMSVIIVVYLVFSFLLNLVLSSVLFFVYRVTLLHIHLGKVPHRQMNFVFSQNVSFPEK